jgi:hypothetical protein
MAAPNFTLLRGGQINQAGDDRALFLKTYGGEVFTAFEEICAFKDRHFTRTIASGKSAQFPSIGGKTAEYHTPGTMIVGAPGNLAETLITIDDFLHSSSAITEIDQAMSHFDYRQPFSTEDGRAIARAFDENVARVGVQAALNTTSRFAGTGDIYESRTVGKVVDVADTDTDAAILKAAMVTMGINFDEKDIPDEDRNLFLKPAQYALLAADNDTISSDYGSASDIRTLKMRSLLGFNMIKTNRLPQTNVTGTYGNKYDVDARNVVALAMLPGAVGTLKVRDLSVGMTGEDYKVTHNSTLVSSKMLVGHGQLRPEMAGVIRTAAPV